MAKRAAFSMYDSFSEKAFGGSQACIISSGDFNAELRARIAKELGVPATAFISSIKNNDVTVRFLSTVMELPMCGHGTVALITDLIQQKAVAWNGAETLNISLCLPQGKAGATVSPREDGRPLVMLDVRLPTYRATSIDNSELCGLIGLSADALHLELPVETVVADFIHLAVPIRGLNEMRSIKPDFGAMVRFCHNNNLETIAVFCLETENSINTLHVRDFCPAVGVPESAAAGTTNAALANYLFRHGVVKADADGRVRVRAEQGIEIRRPSEIRTVLEVSNGAITKAIVGGVAVKVADGVLHL